MGVVQDLADKLAEDAMAASRDLDDPALIEELGKILGDTSSTLQEAFRTSIRVRMAEARARQHLEAKIARSKGAAKTGEEG